MEIQHMKLFHISELTSLVSNGQMVMVLGWLENYSPFSGTALMLSAEKNCHVEINLDLSGCDLEEVVEHALFQVVGNLYHKDDMKVIKVQSIRDASTWNYFTFSKVIENQRNFFDAQSSDSGDLL